MTLQMTIPTMYTFSLCTKMRIHVNTNMFTPVGKLLAHK